MYRELEAPLMPVLADIERAGVRVDTDALAGLSARMQARALRALREIYEQAGEQFNINSPKQLADVLFVKLNLHGRQEDRQDARGLHRAGRARGAGANARAAGARPEVAEYSEAEGHVRRCAALARESGDRTRAHDVQSGGGRDGPAEQQRSESAEHSDPHAARPRDPRRVRRRAGTRADLRRLFTDRIARARASVR